MCRYFVVVDDIWDISIWKSIRCALPNNEVGYTIITTTHISDVAEKAGGAYKMKPLSPENSRKLFFSMESYCLGILYRSMSLYLVVIMDIVQKYYIL